MRSPLMMIAALAVLAGCSDKDADEPHRVEVSGTGEISLPAELADLHLGFGVTADGTHEASERLRAKVNPLVEKLRGSLPDGAELQARTLAVAPQYRWDEGEQSLEGYKATRSIQLMALPVAELGEWTARLSEKGPQRLSVSNFRLREGDTAEQQALARAFQSARRRAQALADSAGRELGQTLSIQEQQVSQPGPRRMMAADTREGAQEADDFEAGSVQARADVRVTFALE
ncbi:SIMPL domain-containing protein [Vreelandella utahensis]|uniref:SIMPL domain-containing protein n=1 Tax=Vreelandella halophila TaxID=86177 RepID=UPI00098459DE|nr:SIMPL domain-containing protein [Halomonas utahensis]